VGLKPLDSSKPVRRAKIVIGKDTRLSGYMIEQALASGVCSMGADVILIGPLPTPGVAFVTQSMRADAGVMISASHNPYYDNGIKFSQRMDISFLMKLNLKLSGWFFLTNSKNRVPQLIWWGRPFVLMMCMVVT
jgi:phosphoglucosamine mutase